MQLLNDRRKFINSQQKGFMKIPCGAAEHVVIADEMIHHAARHRKNLYIMTIDFKDAFGSVPHDLIKKNLLDIGFSQNFVKCVLSSYKDSFTRIISNGSVSNEIVFGKGVKQGCPLSPTLFNLCIEPLLIKLNSMAEDDGYHWFNRSTAVQAYADDIVLFSDTEIGMNNLIHTVENFCIYAGNMVINAKKCSSFAFIIDNGTRGTIQNHFMINNEEVDNICIQGSTQYLGLPLAAKVSQRKKHIFQKLLCMKQDVSKIANSSLKTVQTIDAIKRFILPRVDYELMINAAPINKLLDVDAHIRNQISKKIKAAGIPVDWFYTSKIDGGLNLQSLVERHKALTIRLYVGMHESKDTNVRYLIRASDNDEMQYREAEADLDSPFLNVPTNDTGSIKGNTKRGTSNLLSRAVKALHDLKFKLTQNDNGFVLQSLIDDDNHLEEDVNENKIMKSLMKISQRRHNMSLLRHKLKGHSFELLTNSPISSFFTSLKADAADSIVNFAFKARLGSLFTGSMRRRRTGNEDNGKCKKCGQLETIHHLLNGCQYRKNEFTIRHDAVAAILRDYIINNKHCVVHSNQVVRGRDGARLEGDNTNLKPDLWWWKDDKLYIVEITIPYGMYTDVDGNHTSTLLLRRQQKINKYNSLVNDCKNQFNCDVDFSVIILSSLGALPKETIDELKKLTNTEADWKKMSKKMVMATLKESMCIAYNWRPRSRSVNNGLVNDANNPGSLNYVVHSDVEDFSEDFVQTVETSMSECSTEVWNDLIGSEDAPPNQNPVSVNDSYANYSDSEDADVLTNPGTSPYWLHNVAEGNSTDDSTDCPNESADSSDRE